VNGYEHGQRGIGHDPKRRWIDMINEDCEAMVTMLSETSRQALDRGDWNLEAGEDP
jgi:hypothetical protein